MAIIAATAPTSVEFQIHQVVMAFQVSSVIKAYTKKLLRCCTISARYNKGRKAIKIRKVNGDTGQLAHNSNPDKRLKPVYDRFFKAGKFRGGNYSSLFVCRLKKRLNPKR